MSTQADFKYKNCIQAITKNDLDELKRMYEANYEVQCLFENDTQSLFYMVLINKNIDMIKWLVSLGYRKPLKYQPYCIEYAHYESLMYLWTENLLDVSLNQMLMIRAIQKNDINFFKIIYQRWGKWPDSITALIAEYGTVEFLKFAYENNCKWNINTTSDAIKSNNLECLKFAVEHGCPWHRDTQYWAATTDNIECMKYAYEQGCHWNNDVIFVCAESGHLACLQFAHKNGCEWVEDTTLVAAAYDHVDVLKYAHENKLYWHPDTALEASGHHSINSFTYCFDICTDKSLFWCADFDRMIQYISLDETVWRQLFYVNLQDHHTLQNIVNTKIYHVDLMVKLSTHLLKNYISIDVLHYCVNSMY